MSPWVDKHKVRAGIQEDLARLHEIAAADRCLCGGPKGHAGWLICAFPRLSAEKDHPKSDCGPWNEACGPWVPPAQGEYLHRCEQCGREERLGF